MLSSEGVLLTLRRDLMGWELPGGTVEAGESDEVALRREILEETGHVVEVEGGVGEWIRTGFRPHRVRVYRCRSIGVARERVEDPDVLRDGWFDPRDPPAELLPWYRGALERAVEERPAAAEPVREHWGVTTILAAARIDLRCRLRESR